MKPPRLRAGVSSGLGQGRRGEGAEVAEQGAWDGFPLSGAWMGSVPGWILGGMVVFALGISFGAVMGLVWGIGMAGELADDAWWNPVSAWRSLQAVEGNMVLQIFAPESVTNARAAKGVLVTGMAGMVGVGVAKAKEQLAPGQGHAGKRVKRRAVEVEQGYGGRTLSARLARTPPRRRRRGRDEREREVLVADTDPDSPESPETVTPVERGMGYKGEALGVTVEELLSELANPVARKLFQEESAAKERRSRAYWDKRGAPRLSLRAPAKQEPVIYMHRGGHPSLSGLFEEEEGLRPLRLRMM